MHHSQLDFNVLYNQFGAAQKWVGSRVGQSQNLRAYLIFYRFPWLPRPFSTTAGNKLSRNVRNFNCPNPRTPPSTTELEPTSHSIKFAAKRSWTHIMKPKKLLGIR
jgi:hypothetical protein